jgi:penicillin-binding protein 1B
VQATSRPRRALWWTGIAGLAAVAAGWLALDRRVVEGFRDERWRHAVRVYGAPTVLAAGIDVDELGVAAELRARGYRETPDAPAEPGTFRRRDAALEIHVRAAPRPDRPRPVAPRRLRLELEGGRVREIVAVETGQRLAEATLDPPLFEGVFDDHWAPRRPLSIEEVPPPVVEAILLAEDARYWQHPGVDGGALLRAFRINWEAGELRQGGSTITQQLVKNIYLTPERTFARKLVEIPMALSLEWHFSKRAILEAYLATVYLGHDRLVGVYGLAEAARVYLGKDVAALTLGEGALLGGMIRAPNVYSPLRHPERALARRDQVIAHLERLRRIGPAEAAAARSESLPAPPVRAAAAEAFFLQHVRRELAPGLDVTALRPGSAIFTTLDPRLQGIVSEEVRGWDVGEDGPEVAIVALDPKSGAIRAMVGSRDYLKSQLDRATRAHRSLGPMVEPLLRLTAAGGVAATVSAEADGPQRASDELAELATRLSLPPPPPGARAAEPGELTASLLELVAAYGVLPAAGRRPAPSAVLAVRGPAGEELIEGPPGSVPAVAAAVSQSVHARLLRDFADPALAPPAGDAPAGAYGMTDGRRDAWIVGYAPDFVLGVWTGFDDERPLGPGIESRVAALWRAIFARARAGFPRAEVAASRDPGLVAGREAASETSGPGLLARGGSR